MTKSCHGLTDAERVSSPARQPDPDPIDAVMGIETDHRRAHRETVVAIGRIAGDPGQTRRESVKVLVCDLSLRGVSFRSTAPVSVGDLFDFRLCLGPLRVQSRIRVVRTRTMADGTTQAGCEFV